MHLSIYDDSLSMHACPEVGKFSALIHDQEMVAERDQIVKDLELFLSIVEAH